MRPGFLRTFSVAALGILLSACHSGPPQAPIKGEAFVGPPTLKLRSDIPLQSSTVAVVKHGDKLGIVEQRRSWVKVRAPNGAEGWIEQRQLLSYDEMAALRTLSERAASLPSQGQATTDADLRVHIQPSAGSPGFLTLKENDKVEVLTHLRRDRTDLPRKPLIPPPPKKVKSTRKSGKTAQIPPPPMPIPPSPPSNWVELSKTDTDEDAPEPPAPGPPVPTDDWSLVRTPEGESGWVLTRRIRMAIPDEVGQYAEGHRIVSYFPLGSLPDGDQQKTTWLWTTIGDGIHPYDFDSFRVFVWSAHRHRYETAHVERNLTGYAPVELHRVSYASGRSGEAGQYPGFSVCVENKDGQLVRREYAVLENLVRFAGERTCVLPPPVDLSGSAPKSVTASPAAQVPRQSLWQRIKNRLRSLRRK